MGGLITAAVCAVILIGAAVRGYTLGFLRTAFSMVILVISIVIVSFIGPYVSSGLNRTAIPKLVYKTVYSNMEKQVMTVIPDSGSDSNEEDIGQLKDISLTENQQQVWMTAGNIPQWIQRDICNGEEQTAGAVIEEASQCLSDCVVNIISYLLTLLAAFVLMQVLSMFLGIANYIPILKGINRKLGIVLGLVQGACVLWILSLLLTMFAPSGWGGAVIAAIESSPAAGGLYHILVSFGTFGM